MGSEGEEQQTPLMGSFNDPEMPVKRTGTLWTAIAHVITGVIGAGVLSLAWSTAQLGWVAGPLSMVVFAAITILSTNLLCDCYKFPDPKCGPERNKSYVEAVKLYLGETRRRISVVFLHESLYGCGIAYTITAATSVRNLVGLRSSYNHGVIGSGILSLAWSVAQLGWIAGPASLLGFAIPTYISAFLVSDCYRYPDPVRGTRNPSYKDAFRVILVYWVVQLGNSSGYVLCFSLSLYGVCIAYVITTSLSLRAIQQSNCYHKEGHEANCTFGDTIYMVIFGGVQLIVSQIPDFHNMAWLSVIAAIMSFSYAFIGLGLGVAKVIENGTIKGSIGGVPEATVAEKLWLIFQALGDIAFAYPYSIILFEIQDTLKSPPPENQTMKKASVAAIFITTFFYLCCGCFGYAAFGSDTPGNLLTGFGFYEPYWLIDFANACVILHLVGGYQVYSQPLFAYGERWVSEKFPNSRFVNNSYAIKLPFLPAFQLSLLRLCFRTVYVVSTTAIAVVFPYFNQVLGVLGALNFWPLAIYFPVEMYFVQRKIEAWTTKWVVLQTFSIVCLVVSILGLIGSIEGLISAKFG